MFIDFLNVIPAGIADGLQFALLALGVYITYRLLDFPDLSVDGTFALGGAVVAVLINGGWNPILAMIVAMLCGAIAGLFTAILHTKLRIPPILAGILTMLALYSINIRIMGKSNAPIAKSTIFTVINNLVDNSNVSIIIIGTIIAVLSMGALYWFMGTEVGAGLRATGINSQMAKAQGINTDNSKIVGLMISNGLVAVAGAFMAQCAFNANVDMGSGAIVIGLASVIIGEMLFGKNRSFAIKLISVVVGAIIYRLIINFALFMGLKSTDLKLVSALIVVVALSVPFIQNEVSKKKKSRKNNSNIMACQVESSNGNAQDMEQNNQTNATNNSGNFDNKNQIGGDNNARNN